MLTQTEAREIAKQRGGVATLAKPRKGKTPGWKFGGWADRNSQWVVELPTGEVISEKP